MKNKILFFVSVAFLIVAGAFVLNSMSVMGLKSYGLGKGLQNEMDIMSFDILAATASKKIPAIPDPIQAANLNASVLQKPLEYIVDWQVSHKSPSSKFKKIAGSIYQCTTCIVPQNSLTSTQEKELSQDEYTANLTQYFCPEKQGGVLDSSATMKKAFANTLSLLTLVGNTTYSYSVSVVNIATGCRLDATVEQDKRVSLPICAVANVVIVSSKTLFKGSQGWQSHKEILHVIVPDVVSDITTYLKTEVYRKKQSN